jgi:hypothetical protein
VGCAPPCSNCPVEACPHFRLRDFRRETTDANREGRLAHVPFLKGVGTGPSGRGSYRSPYQISFNPN